MKCEKPYNAGGFPEFGCGSCEACLLNRKRLWTSRLMLEAQLHHASWFVTLTYNEENYPEDHSVSVREAQLFLKRLRALVSPEVIRHYLVGEYGEQGGRPHYHAFLFGLSDPRAVEMAWRLGHVHVGEVTEQSAAYLVSYITKSRTAGGGLEYVDSDGVVHKLRPEFAIMSRGGRGGRGGIGTGAVGAICSALVDRDGVIRSVDGDVPAVVRQSKTRWPLGRTLREKLRRRLGFPSRRRVFGADSYGVPSTVMRRRAAEVLSVPRAQREQARVHSGRRARRLISISRSKKGL